MAVSKTIVAAAPTNPATILTLAGALKLNPASEGTETREPLSRWFKKSIRSISMFGSDLRQAQVLIDRIGRPNSISTLASRFPAKVVPIGRLRL